MRELLHLRILWKVVASNFWENISKEKMNQRVDDVRVGSVCTFS